MSAAIPEQQNYFLSSSQNISNLLIFDQSPYNSDAIAWTYTMNVFYGRANIKSMALAQFFVWHTDTWNKIIILNVWLTLDNRSNGANSFFSQLFWKIAFHWSGHQCYSVALHINHTKCNRKLEKQRMREKSSTIVRKKIWSEVIKYKNHYCCVFLYLFA